MLRTVFVFLSVLQLAASTSRGTTPEAAQTATDLMREIGEDNSMDDSMAMNDRRERAAKIASSRSIPSNEGNIPHYSLFAPHHEDSSSIESSASSGAELRFKANAANLQLQSASSSTSENGMEESSDQTDVVGSFTVLLSHGEARRVATSEQDVVTLQQASHDAILNLVNPFGPNNQTLMTIGTHMIETKISFPSYVVTKRRHMDTNTTSDQMRSELTINVALRGMSIIQGRAALAELSGIDFLERMTSLYRLEKEKNGNGKREKELLGMLHMGNSTEFGMGHTKVGITVACPLLCGSKGKCTGAATCECFSGFAGYDCSDRTCEYDCGVHGSCDDQNKTCVCDQGYVGDACEIEFCPNACSSRGICNETAGVCNCAEHWTGEDCATPLCPENCAGHGACVVGPAKPGEDLGYGGVMPMCECDGSWSGEWCASPACSLGENGMQCSGNAHACVNRTCQCRPGYQGEDCGQESCPNDCSNHGEVNFFYFFVIIFLSLFFSSFFRVL